MHFFLCLLLGHLLGDFPLQTDAVYRLKAANTVGIILHAGVVTVVTILLVIPYGWKAVAGVVVLGVLHGVVDRVKMYWQDRAPRRAHTLFWVDQGVHVALLLLLAVVLGFPAGGEKAIGWLPAWYWEPAILGIIVAYLVTAFLGAIWLQTAAFAYCHPGDRRQSIWLTREEKWVGIIERLLITTGVWWGWMSLWLGGIVLATGVYMLRWQKWMSLRFWGIKALLGWVLAVGVGVILRFMSS